MSGRYTRLFALPENLYAEGSPALIDAGALLKDNQTGSVLAQLKLQNISGKVMKAVTVKLEPLDAAGKPKGDAVTYQYLDLKAERDAVFGQKVPVMLSDASIRGFRASVTEVVFTDNSIWQGSAERWEPLPKQKSLELEFGEAELVKEYRIRYGTGCSYLYREDQDIWRCACGAINRRSEPRCHVCRKEAAVLRALDVQELAESKEKRLAAEAAKRREQEEAERARAEEARLAAERTKKKIMKISVVAAAAAVVIAAAVTLNSRVLQPLLSYRKAEKLMEQGEYDAAVKKFAALGAYSDAADKIKEARYQKAESLFAAGEYDAAGFRFKELGNYSDAADKSKEAYYQKAESLFTEGQYDAAADEFAALKDYADAPDKSKESHYKEAESLLAAGQYDAAAEKFAALEDYADAADRVLESYYIGGTTYLQEQKYLEASEELMKIRGYKDVDTLLSENQKVFYSAQFTVGNEVLFGRYEQDGNTGNGAEEIEWLVLDRVGNHVLLLSKYGLDAKPYNEENIRSITWEQSTIRQWLNSTFFNTAFSSEEQAAILETEVDNSQAGEYSEYFASGNNTKDRVFLLSYKEAEDYFDRKGKRICLSTAYAVQNGASTDDDKSCYWWLRSRYTYRDEVICVGTEGYIPYQGRVNLVSVCVRPAVWINLEADSF